MLCVSYQQKYHKKDRLCAIREAHKKIRAMHMFKYIQNSIIIQIGAWHTK